MPIPVPQTNTTSQSLQSIQQQTSMNLFKTMKDTGGTGFVNPVTLPINNVNAYFRQNSEAVKNQIGTMMPDDPNYTTLRSFQTALDDGTGQLKSLQTHTDTLIHGDDKGSPISGGLMSNVSQATAAVSLQNQMVAAGMSPEGSHSESDPCALIGDFFNSIIGKGRELIAQINNLVQSAMQSVSQLINQINTAITAGMNALREAINTAVGAIRDAISEIGNLIKSELESFAKWLNLGNLFNMSSFLSGIYNNKCIRPIIDAVGPPVMTSILAQGQVGATRVAIAALGPIW